MTISTMKRSKSKYLTFPDIGRGETFEPDVRALDRGRRDIRLGGDFARFGGHRYGRRQRRQAGVASGCAARCSARRYGTRLQREFLGWRAAHCRRGSGRARRDLGFERLDHFNAHRRCNGLVGGNLGGRILERFDPLGIALAR